MRMAPPKISPRIHLVESDFFGMEFDAIYSTITGKPRAGDRSPPISTGDAIKMLKNAKDKGMILDYAYERSDFSRSLSVVIAKTPPIGKKLKESMERLGQRTGPSAASVTIAIRAEITRIRRSQS